MDKLIFDERTGLNYKLAGDYYLLAGEDDPVPTVLGIWGQRHRVYLKTHKEGIYTDLWLSGKLDSYLVELNQQATERFDLLIAQMAKAQGVNERLKARDQMAWVGAMNNIYSAATEIVDQEFFCMKKLREKMIAYLKEHPINFGYSDAETVTEFLYDVYCEARQEEPPEIRELAKQLSPYLERMPRTENDAMFGIIIKMCIAHERNAFKEGFWLGLKLDTES